ncbi:hypothetical protein AAG906_037932 [Vitis piasezkii]
MEGMQNDLSQKIDNIQYSISRLTNLNTVNEKGKFPSQPSQNPKGVHEIETQDGESSNLRKVKAVITLRSGKEVDQPLPNLGPDEKLISKRPLTKEGKNQEEQSGKKSASKSSIEEEPRIVIKEDMMKKHMPPPFPQALHGKKEIKNSSKFLKWTGPFIIHEVHPNGVVEIFNPTGNQTFKVNGHRLKPFLEPYSTDKEEINLLEPPQN